MSSITVTCTSCNACRLFRLSLYRLHDGDWLHLTCTKCGQTMHVSVPRATDESLWGRQLIQAEKEQE
jgi:transcription elongation factor Elf1